ncbi:MAG: hypothetical protein NZ455_16565 [Bacteroidia bacterium]|nr:hypothetical protein [Bacteroidia bacterium]MDW8348378.1 hypothetical protein [Bacteroidia bacterium]
MKKIIIFYFLLQSFLSLCQLSQNQKDSLVKWLEYPKVNYGMDIKFDYKGYKTSHQSPNVVLSLSELNQADLSAKIQNNYKDAPLYGAMCIQALKQNNRQQAENYFAKSTQLFQEWQSKETNNPLPYLQLIEFLWLVKAYSYLESIIQEALAKFPQEYGIVEHAFLFNLFVLNDFNQSEKHLKEMEKQSHPYDIEVLYYYQVLRILKIMTTLDKFEDNKTIDYDYSIVEKAMQANPKSVGHAHLYHYCVIVKGFLKLCLKYIQAQKQSKHQVTYKGLQKSNKKEIKQIQKSEMFLKKNLHKMSDNQKIYVFSHIGTACFLTGKSDEAVSYFDKAWQREQRPEFSDAINFIYSVTKQWDSLEKRLKKEAQLSPQNIKPRAGLVLLYQEGSAIPNHKALSYYVQEIEQISTTDKLKRKVLSVWYLKEKNFNTAPVYVYSLEDDFEGLSYKMTLAALEDQASMVKTYFDKAYQLDPENSYILKVKSLLKY